MSLSERKLVGDRIGTVVAEPFKGTPNFGEVHAQLAPTCLVRPGEIVLIEIEEGVRYSVGRVEQGIEHNPYETPDAVHTRTLLELESTSRREDMPRRYRIIKIDLLEETEVSNKLREPQTIIEAGSPVFRPNAGSISVALGLLPPGGEESGLNIGSTIGANSLPVILKTNDVHSRHILVIGTTGTGKSLLRGVLAEEIHRLGVPQVGVDVHGESNDATRELGGQVLIPGKTLTIKLSSLSEPEVMGFIPFLTELQGEIVRRAFLELKKRFVASGTPFDLADLLAKIKAL